MAKQSKKPTKAKAKKPTKKPNPQYAYTIKDQAFGKFSVLYSDNAWWMDSTKVQKLIDAFKIGAPIKEAKVYAGISEREWEYFNIKHPEFCGIKEACGELPNLQARETVVKDLKTSVATSQWWLARKKKKEFGDAPTVENKIKINFSEEAEKRAKKYDKV